MRKLIGLLFLTATLTATSAHAQGIFIDRGDPNAVSATAGGRYLVDSSFAGSLTGGFTYRGVFDVGAELTYLKYNAGDFKKLAGIGVAPYLTWHLMRGEEEELPVSIAVTVAVMREFLTGNAPVANPEAWGVFFGPSIYRKFELGTSTVFIPEVLTGYDGKSSRKYSGALDQTMGSADQSTGYSSSMKHNVRALLRLNLLFKTAGKARYTVTPYVGYQTAVTAGANFGALF
jgi:hypothetical protein